MKITYKPRGVCSRLMEIEIEDGKIASVQVTGGCDGNLKALGLLLEGTDAREAADRLRGNDCGGRGTSCADQLARAIDQALDNA